MSNCEFWRIGSGLLMERPSLHALGLLLAAVEQGTPLKEVPYSVDVFMNAPIGKGSIRIKEPLSKAGDLIDLRAETDLLVAISNCPQERNACNADTPTRLRVVVFGPLPA